METVKCIPVLDVTIATNGVVIAAEKKHKSVLYEEKTITKVITLCVCMLRLCVCMYVLLSMLGFGMAVQCLLTSLNTLHVQFVTSPGFILRLFLSHYLMLWTVSKGSKCACMHE